MPDCVAMTVSLFSQPIFSYFGNKLDRESSALPDEVVIGEPPKPLVLPL